MTTDITELAQSLKAAAEKATPGEWVYFPKNTSIEYDVGSDESQGSILYVDSGDFTQAQTDRNGEFIALANPANILALVEALEKAQQRIAELEEAEQKLCAANISLDARAELAERQLAEMESRTVKLPPTFWYEHDDLSRDVPVLDKRLVKKMLREAGIKVEQLS
ncbi:ead/Ea22-like family protein [Klebsiella quasipneumoniae]|uniref:ead/Ea22-like family protein n=1 Tax=Klebsiella quasipneumoniae TaxID=1463165 RepID=UPI001292CFEE|nr:ead/Ea22-like family protein [Klebsiella quasipneumoniae]QFZ70130.1 hypothetical protein GFK78_16825 [Klebsiella quasipneumoniae]